MTLTRIFTEAHQALTNRKPFALIRLGDGEGRVLMWPTRICREMMDRHLEFWFGRSDFEDEQIGDMRTHLVQAIIDADAIGCYRGGGRNKYWRYPAKFLEHRDLQAGKLETCNAIHRKLWEAGALDMLIEQAEDVGIVTCRDVWVPFSKKYDKVPLWERVPEESKISRIQNNHLNDLAIYRRRITRQATTVDLWLVGAGVLGKIYCADIKRAGGVAIDIGSVFDGWADVKSRSYLTGDNFRLRDKEA